MFFKTKRNTRRNGHIDSLIGSGTVIHGDVRFSDGLHIDGVVKGNVVAEGEHSMLTMSEKGRIEGEVWVHDIVLNGEVVGDVHATHHVELAPNARVTGNVYYNLIEMAMGAEVNGSLVHEAESTSPQPNEPTAEASEATGLAPSQS
jgi:cytoskeletal protein CcmA (bactofilin family)